MSPFVLACVIGSMLFLAKLGSFILLVPKKARHWVHQRPVAQGILDMVFGYLGLHVLAIGGGSMLAMMALVVYSAESMTYIYLTILANRGKKYFQERRIAKCASSGRL